MSSQKNVIYGEGTLCNQPIKIVPPPQGVEFGKYCAIAPNLKIMGINHDYNYPAVQNTFYKEMFNTNHPIDQSSNIYSKGKIIIGNDVWIGEDVFILSGVTIGDGCCIGSRSVITKDLPPYTICVGQPCKPIKNRYNKEIIDFLFYILLKQFLTPSLILSTLYLLSNLIVSKLLLLLFDNNNLSCS
jgi:acetyltransferase-like isoleucine patch superfamily enzyme